MQTTGQPFPQNAPGQITAHNRRLVTCMNARAYKVLHAVLSLGSVEMTDAKRMARLVCVEIQDAACTGKCQAVLNRCIQPKSTSIWVSGLGEPDGISNDEISFL